MAACVSGKAFGVFSNPYAYVPSWIKNGGWRPPAWRGDCRPSSRILGESRIAVVCVCLLIVPTNTYRLRSPRTVTSAMRGRRGTVALNHLRENKSRQIMIKNPVSWDQVADRGFAPWLSSHTRDSPLFARKQDRTERCPILLCFRNDVFWFISTRNSFGNQERCHREAK